MVSWQDLALEGEQLGCARGGRALFAGLAFSLKAGEALHIAGANGAGKTTMIRAIAGLMRFDTGTVRLTGGEAGRELGEQAHYVGHLDAIKPQLTAAETLAFWRDYLGANAHGGGANMTKSAAGLPESALDVPARFLSAGQRRKLALARLALAPRPLWLLDEPAVSLDRQARGALADMMRTHLAAGGLIVAASHTDLGIAFSQRIALGRAAP